jgi:hypothetical protein
MKKLLAAVLLAASTGTYAAPPGPIGRVFASTIDSIRIDTDGYATVYFTQTIYPDFLDTREACRQVDMDHALAFDANTDAGKNILAVLLEAKASGLRVTSFGTGRCMVVNEQTVEMLHFVRATS